MVLIITVGLVFFIDQLTKYLILKNYYIGESHRLISGILHLTYVKNTGTAFGLLHNNNLFFIIFTIIFFIVLFVYRHKIFSGKRKNSIYFNITFGMIIGGAIGNLFDRVFRGSVVDFIDFRIWPVFNIADSCISIASLMLLMYVWKSN